MDIVRRSNHALELQSYMFELYQSQTMTDMEVVTPDMITYNVHKLVITASSQYFLDMCNKPDQTTHIKLALCGELLGCVLEFCYTGQLYIPVGKWDQVYDIALTLQMYTLMELMKQSECQPPTMIISTPHLHDDVEEEMLPSPLNQQIDVPLLSLEQTDRQTADDDEQKVEDNHVSQPSKMSPYKTRSRSKVKQISYTDLAYGPQSESDLDISDDLDLKQDPEFHPDNKMNCDLDLCVQPQKGRGRPKKSTCKSEMKVAAQKSKKEVNKKVTDMVRSKTNHVKTRNSIHGTSNGSFKKDKMVKESSTIAKTTEVKSKTKVRGKTKLKSETKVRDETELKSETKVRGETKLKSETKVRGRTELKSEAKVRGRTELKSETKVRGRSELKSETKFRKLIYGKMLVPKLKRQPCKDCNQPVLSRSGCHSFGCKKGAHIQLARYRYILKMVKRNSIRQYCSAGLTNCKVTWHCTVCWKTFKLCSQTRRHFESKHRKGIAQNEKVTLHWLRFVKDRKQKWLNMRKQTREHGQRGGNVESMNTDDTLSADHRKAKKVGQSRWDKYSDCMYCDKRFRSKVKLKEHLAIQHEAENWEHLALKHEVEHGKIKDLDVLFECAVCGENCKSQWRLMTHLKLIHGLTTEEIMIKYSETHEPMDCLVMNCEFTSASLKAMSSHIQDNHPFLKFPCLFCKRNTYYVEMELKRHQLRCRAAGKQRLPCNRCDKVFLKPKDLKMHEFCKHNIQHPDLQVFECDFDGCGYKTVYSSAIKKHCLIHNRKTTYPCEYCDRVLKTQLIYRKHVRVAHHGIRPFLCQICGTGFGEVGHLKAHINSLHSMEKIYKCQYCDYSTAVKGGYQDHLFHKHKIRAEGDTRRVYQCDQCPFSTMLPSKYKKHLPTHTGEKNFVCNICGKVFGQSSSLSSHKQWLHSDDRFSCAQCDYHTKTNRKLMEHIRVQHQLKGLKPYTCKYCNFPCATSSNMSKHIKHVHCGQPLQYDRDDKLLEVARKARDAGHYFPLKGTPGLLDNGQIQVVKDEVREPTLEIVL